jgi:hypothetical protein
MKVHEDIKKKKALFRGHFIFYLLTISAGTPEDAVISVKRICGLELAA